MIELPFNVRILVGDNDSFAAHAFSKLDGAYDHHVVIEAVLNWTQDSGYLNHVAPSRYRF